MLKPSISKDTKITILKIAVLAAGGACVASALGLRDMEKQYRILLLQKNEKYQELFRDAKLNHKMLMRYVELGGPELAEKIKNEFEFDVVTRHIEDIEE
jgi:hypothetical protein